MFEITRTKSTCATVTRPVIRIAPAPWGRDVYFANILRGTVDAVVASAVAEGLPTVERNLEEWRSCAHMWRTFAPRVPLCAAEADKIIAALEEHMRDAAQGTPLDRAVVLLREWNAAIHAVGAGLTSVPQAENIGEIQEREHAAGDAAMRAYFPLAHADRIEAQRRSGVRFEHTGYISLRP